MIKKTYNIAPIEFETEVGESILKIDNRTLKYVYVVSKVDMKKATIDKYSVIVHPYTTVDEQKPDWMFELSDDNKVGTLILEIDESVIDRVAHYVGEVLVGVSIVDKKIVAIYDVGIRK